MDGPTISKDEPRRVRYWAKRVTHHVPFDLPAVHFQFNADSSAASFGIKYRLIAANIREPKTGAVNMKLMLVAPASRLPVMNPQRSPG